MMNTSKKLMLASVALIVGALAYDAYRGNKPAEKEPEMRRHKSRHLNPVFSKMKEKQSTLPGE